MKVRDIAIARSGDKGNRATLSVIVRDAVHLEKHFQWLEKHLTAERVYTHYQGIFQDVADEALPSGGAGQVTRYLLPHLGAVHFVLNNALGGGVTRSLALDAHGKTLSAAILDVDLEND